MVLSEEKKLEYIKRLLLSRMRILVRQGFYGILLMHMQFSLDDGIETAATDGKRILFNPDFLEKLNDRELDFTLMHEILHCALRHCQRGRDYDQEEFNISCDIVVNSNILLSSQMDLSAITLRNYGESMHIAPDGREGYEYTAEQVYEMLMKKAEHPSERWDDHTHWEDAEVDEESGNVWAKRLEDACQAISVRDPSGLRGLLPMCAQRLLMELHRPQTDWKKILNDFIQEEIVDYSFTPPDRRFSDSGFFLPDFNEKDDMAEDILFMIDTSGSMSDEMVTVVYSEVKGAIDQFGGKLKGWLGFFDAAVIEPEPFRDEQEFRQIKPAGGGGTDFGVIFTYVRENMSQNLPAIIIILTDGHAPFPEEAMALHIPVLWVLNNEEVTPPWGRVIRIV